MKAILNQQKKAIKTSEVKHLYAPQYETLSIENILRLAQQHREIYEFLPEGRDVPMLPRQVSIV